MEGGGWSKDCAGDFDGYLTNIDMRCFYIGNRMSCPVKIIVKKDSSHWSLRVVNFTGIGSRETLNGVFVRIEDNQNTLRIIQGDTFKNKKRLLWLRQKF